MAEGSVFLVGSGPATDRSESARAPGNAPAAQARAAYRAALALYRGSRLTAIRLAQGGQVGTARVHPAEHADAIAEYLDHPASALALVERLPAGPRLALTLLAVTEKSATSMGELYPALAVLGADAHATVTQLLELGLLVVAGIRGPLGEDMLVSFAELARRPYQQFLVHPVVLKAVRTAPPDEALRKAKGAAISVREPDGLEPILRLGALWQRVGAEPLRQTLHGTLYKRDRERLDDDPALAAPLADELKRLPDLSTLWLELARQIGLLAADNGNDKLVAAPPEFWTDNAVHLPQMIAVGWMSLRAWREFPPGRGDGTIGSETLPYLRVALLLLLSTVKESGWVVLDDLVTQVADAWAVDSGSPLAAGDAVNAANNTPSARGKSRTRQSTDPRTRATELVESLLLGAAYPLGLVRAAEEDVTRKRLIQLTPLGRYVLALGSTPPPRPTFDQFLLVQPNYEMVAYRQGLTPQLVGHLSRFAWWSQIGSALELKITRESVVQGLDGGLSPEEILATLTRHSQRALPPAVVSAVGNWASRREWVTYYTSATLIEFGSESERDAAISLWQPGRGASPVAVSQRFLLVEDERTVPFDRLRLTSSRDYRRPPEVCVTVEPDGVTLTLDPTRADLLVDAELLRFAEDVPLAPAERGHAAGGVPGRRFQVTAASLVRGLARGMSPLDLADWFRARTGSDLPAAVQLILAARTGRVPPLKATHKVVMTLPSAKLLDGLVQHPATAPLLGERLGPLTVSIPAELLPALRAALKELGVELEVEGILAT